MDDPHVKPAAGQVTSPSSPSCTGSLERLPHCETCGRRLTHVIENDHLVGYWCFDHGPLTHDAIVWVYHEREE